MKETEQRQILEAIARDTDCYPRDRIAAVKALRDMDAAAGQALMDELEELVADK